MKEFETNYIKKLIDIMKNNELTEITLEDNNKSVVIKTNGYNPVIKEVQKQESGVQTKNGTETIPPKTEEPKELVPVLSNMIGIYYSRPNPESEPFVSVGDEIKEGQIVCIIETIKLVNKIAADTSGKVVRICIEDGKPVEYGQVIMYIEKNQR